VFTKSTRGFEKLFIIERRSNNSREARRVDFVGLRTTDARIVSTHSSQEKWQTKCER
jgi:hypothetical protein